MLKAFYMIEASGKPTDCNDLPLGSMAYTYYNTVNSPSTETGWIVFTFGASNNYKVQLAINCFGHGMKVRGFEKESGWFSWKTISLS